MSLESTNTGRLLLYAPNVHTGGGAMLLHSLLDAVQPEQEGVAWLDMRARNQYKIPSRWSIHWVTPRVSARLLAEWQLQREARATDRLVCFHGLPPLLRSPAHTTVFQQNRNYLGQVPLSRFTWRTRIRLLLEQIISRKLRSHVDTYQVQTPSMANALKAWWGDAKMPPVNIMGFAPMTALRQSASMTELKDGEKLFDFIYVADGEAHKNHQRLIEAWVILASQGLRPKLALVLGNRNRSLISWINKQALEAGLEISCLDAMTHEQLLCLYSRCGALIFPSLGESYGLPLIEARAIGLPILAGELDYVRDVCEPANTFDAYSANSIAQAVQRHLGASIPPAMPVSAADFLKVLLS